MACDGDAKPGVPGTNGGCVGCDWDIVLGCDEGIPSHCGDCWKAWVCACNGKKDMLPVGCICNMRGTICDAAPLDWNWLEVAFGLGCASNIPPPAEPVGCPAGVLEYCFAFMAADVGELEGAGLEGTQQDLHRCRRTAVGASAHAWV